MTYKLKIICHLVEASQNPQSYVKYNPECIAIRKSHFTCWQLPRNQSVVLPYAKTSLHKVNAPWEKDTNILEEKCRISDSCTLRNKLICLSKSVHFVGSKLLFKMLLSICVNAVCICNKQEDQVFVCGLKYFEEDYEFDEEVEVEIDSPLRLIEENVSFFEDDEVELIKVPVPEFKDGDPAGILHDFTMVQKYTDTHKHTVFIHNHHRHIINHLTYYQSRCCICIHYKYRIFSF